MKTLEAKKSKTERAFQAIGFEVVGLLICTPLFALIMGTPMFEMGGLVIINVGMAFVWNIALNAAYDHFEQRFGIKRSALTRVFHAILFEVGFALFTIPVIAFYLGIGLLQALALDIGFILFYMPYTYVYHWAYDEVRAIVLRSRLV